MGRVGLAIRVGVTAFVVLLLLLPWRVPTSGGWTFKLERAALREGQAVIAGLPDAPLPPGLAAGDRIDTPRMPIRDRLSMQTQTVMPGTPLVLPILHVDADGRVQRRTVAVRAVPYGPPVIPYLWPDWPFLLLGLLLLWRGRARVAWGVATVVLAVGSLGTAYSLSLPLPWHLGQRAFVEYFLRPILAFGSMVVLLGLLGGARPRLSRWIKWVYGVLFALYYLDRLLMDLPWLLHGKPGPGVYMQPVMWVTVAFIVQFIVFSVLISRSVDAASRLRARWVLLGIVLYTLSILTILMFQSEYALLPYFLSLLALAYATLRHKLVPTTFAISRTVVFAIVAALIVGIFAVVEHAVAALAMGKNAGLAVHLGVPLVLGILVHRIHGKVEHWVERLFFRKQYDAEALLDRLVQESAYIEHPGPLIARTLQDVSSALHAPRVALYWHGHDGGYRRRGQTSEGAWPKHVDVDDPVFVSLRAGKPWAELESPRSPLGIGGIAFPMRVAGRLQGAIICGDRTSQYAQEERKSMARVANAVGIALHALSAQASQNAMESLLAGSTSLEDMRRQLGLAEPESTPAPQVQA